MKADRLEFYRNQIRDVPVADLGRMMWQVLMQATDEAARDEREECAQVAASHSSEPWKHDSASVHVCDMVSVAIASSIRARGAA